MIQLSNERKDAIRNYIFPKVWDLNPTGNPDQICDFLIAREEQRAPEYTAEIICKKYIDYFNKWSYEHDGQEERYIGKDDKLIDFYQFMVKNMFTQEFAIARKGRDLYLFGDMNKETLQRLVNGFIKKMSYGRR